MTHAIIHKYYCQYCFGYHEYCQASARARRPRTCASRAAPTSIPTPPTSTSPPQYCFYYNDYTWLHRMWSTGVNEISPAGEPIGNQFGGSLSIT